MVPNAGRRAELDKFFLFVFDKIHINLSICGFFSRNSVFMDSSTSKLKSVHVCLLLVLVLAPRGFSPGTPVFPSPQK